MPATMQVPEEMALSDDALLRLHEGRAAAWESLGTGGGKSSWLRNMTPERRANAEDASRRFNAADAAIVAELVRRRAPAVLGEITLSLTADRLHYVTLETATGRPVGLGSGYDSHGYDGLILDYTGVRWPTGGSRKIAAGRHNCPAMVP